jgi:hypothetical protein
VRFFFDNPSDDDEDAILLRNGIIEGLPHLDEPHFYDGRHRLVAAVLRGDKTRKARLRWNLPAYTFLSWSVIAYLTGESDRKPESAQSRASASE